MNHPTIQPINQPTNQSIPGESLGGCSLRHLTTRSWDGFMRSSLAFSASWNFMEPPIALTRIGRYVGICVVEVGTQAST